MNRPKGTKDYFGKEELVRNYVKSVILKNVKRYNIEEIETPIFEHQEVFVKSVGEISDIVSKEMYVFKDKSDRKLVLRPEGTAGVARAIVENKFYAQIDKLKVFYYGPMFRYENPQKGRQRQFTQFGVEIVGTNEITDDIEVILLINRILSELGIKFKLKINSLGDIETRVKYLEVLRTYFSSHISELSELSQKRIQENPLRILDDKIDREKDVVIDAPRIDKYYSQKAKVRFDNLIKTLDELNIEYEIDNMLVRGLDYYTDTIFEYVSISGLSGSQSTLLGGGRYDYLLEQFEGPSLSGVGFAFGIERICNELNADELELENKNRVNVYLGNINITDSWSILKIAEIFRKHDLKVECNTKESNIQKIFARSDKYNAKSTVLLGEKDLNNNQLTIKINKENYTIKIEELDSWIQEHYEELK